MGGAFVWGKNEEAINVNLHKLIFTENACYKAGRTITVKGIMVHSTGANNPWLKRYVGPDDGLLGKNTYSTHWNQPMSESVCVHAFIGKLADGSIATYQTLPWNHRGWHAGGSANNTHIGFEICEDGLTDAAYFGKVYKEAVELCAYLCKLYNLTEKDIICHSEGRKKGIASNHADVMHWFPKHGKSMDTFRKDVAALLASGVAKEETTTTKKQLYRVRKAWNDAASQLGAFVNLEYAKPLAKSNPGYKVFDIDGNIVYDPAKTTANNEFKPYLVKVTASVLNVRAGAGTSYKVNTTVKNGEVYTIVGEKNGWGKLKSGAGWVSLKYCMKL